MNYETTIEKGRDGWKAESVIPLGFKHGSERERALRVLTYKTSRGGLFSSAQCVEVDPPNERGIGGFRFVMFGDFRTTLEEDRAARCTEASVKALHSRALEGIGDVIAACRRFYKQPESQAGEQADPVEAAMSDTNYVGHPIHY